MTRNELKSLPPVLQVLWHANTKLGAPSNIQVEALCEASRAKLVYYAGNPQNSMTGRYKLTEAGRAALTAAGL